MLVSARTRALPCADHAQFVKGLLVFLSLLIGKHGGSTIIQAVDG
jgi:hypothetical protein